jgi:SnoaL-like domain
MTPLTPRALALEWGDALRARDAERFARMFAPDGVLLDVEHRTEDHTRAKPVIGRTAIEATTRAWFASTPDFAYEVLDVLAGRDQAAVLWRYAILNRASPLSLDGVTWLVCRAGSIERALVFFDSHELLLETGRVSAYEAQPEGLSTNEFASLRRWLEEIRLMSLEPTSSDAGEVPGP